MIWIEVSIESGSRSATQVCGATHRRLLIVVPFYNKLPALPNCGTTIRTEVVSETAGATLRALPARKAARSTLSALSPYRS